jgi:hypothetical protein
MKRLFQNLDELLGDKYVITEVDWHMENELAEKYHVFGIPTLLVIRGGEITARYSGIVTSSELLESLNTFEQKVIPG